MIRATPDLPTLHSNRRTLIHRMTLPMLAVLIGTAPGWAPAPAAAQDLLTLRGIETRLLERRLDEYEDVEQRARVAESEYTSIRRQLSSVLGDSNVQLERLRELEAQASLARERAYLRDREATTLRREIYSHLERIEEMDRELDGIGPLINGTWITDFGPDFGEGTMELRMSGDRIQGSYRLENGATGRITGELVGAAVTLVRYSPGGNPQLEARGLVATNGRTMSGNWVARELGAGRNAIGTWSARRGEDQ